VVARAVSVRAGAPHAVSGSRTVVAGDGDARKTHQGDKGGDQNAAGDAIGLHGVLLLNKVGKSFRIVKSVVQLRDLFYSNRRANRLQKTITAIN
jgi:hypothetical protein